MPLPAILAGLTLGRALLYVSGAAIVGWGLYSVYDAIRDRGHARGVADTLQAERLCTEGTVCAEAVTRRAAEAVTLVEQARQKAREEERLAIAADMQLLEAARAREASRAAAAVRAREQADRRLLDAIASNQACREWAAAEVPCPVT